MFPSRSAPAKTLRALYELAVREGYAGHDPGPQASQHWEFMEERTGLSRAEIGATLVSLERQGLVIAIPASTDYGAHLGHAWISPEGVTVVQSMIVKPDLVPVTIMGFGDEAVSALQQLVVLAKRSQVEERDVAVLEERIATLETASDDEDRLQQAADIASVIAGSESLMRLFIVMVFPLLGRAFGG